MLPKAPVTSTRSGDLVTDLVRAFGDEVGLDGAELAFSCEGEGLRPFAADRLREFGMEVGAAFDDRHHRVVIAAEDRRVQRRHPAVREGQRRLRRDEYPHDSVVTVLRGERDRALTLLVGELEVRVVLGEERDELVVTAR